MTSSKIADDIMDAGASGDLAKLREVKEKLGDDKEFRRICDVFSLFCTGQRVLHRAAKMGHFKICKFLIENVGVQIDPITNREDTPLVEAAKEGHIKVMKYLIKKGAGVHMSNAEGYTALHYAVLKDNMELMRLLLLEGAPIEADSVGGMPLQCAASRGSVESVKLLLENGAKPNTYSSYSEPPLICAIKSRSFECMELLLDAKANPNHMSYGLYPLVHAAKLSDTKFLKALLDAGADPNPPDTGLPEPIEEAAAANNVKGVEILFPLAEPLADYPNWSVDGIMNYSLSEEAKIKREENRKSQLDTLDKLGKVMVSREDYLNAIRWYGEAIELDRSNPKWWSNRSLCFVRLGEGVPALRDAEECCRLDSDSAKAHYRRGVAWKLFKNHHMATVAFMDAHMRAPKNKEILNAHRVALSEYSAWQNIYCPEEKKGFPSRVKDFLSRLNSS